MFYKQNKRMVHYLLIGVPIVMFLLGQIMESILIYSLLAIGLFLMSIALLLQRMNIMLSHKETQLITQTQNQSRQLDLVVEQLRTLITFLPYPMILVDQQGTIELKNNSFELLLNDLSEETSTITSTNIPFPIRRLLNDSYLNEESVTKTIALNTMEYQYISIPITQDTRYKGSLIVMHDITKLLYQERVQKRFVADASHELKTPITAIKGMVEILTRPDFNDEVTHLDFMEQIKAETNRLETIVNDLLYLSKLNSKTILLNKQPLDVYAIVAESLRTFKIIINEKNIDVEINNISQTPLIADAASLTTIFNNLIDNVCTYSQATKLTIQLDDNHKNKIISVEDNGMGIEEKEFTHIFERFYRVDDARNRSTGGSGLGLSIVKELVEAHGGSIHIESKKNVFTKFVIYLPNLTKS